MQSEGLVLSVVWGWVGLGFLLVHGSLGGLVLWPLGLLGLPMCLAGWGAAVAHIAFAKARGERRQLLPQLLTVALTLVLLLLVAWHPGWSPGRFEADDGSVVCLRDDGTYRWVRGSPPKASYRTEGTWSRTDRSDNDLSFGPALACTTVGLWEVGFHLHDRHDTSYTRVGPCAPLDGGVR